MTAVSSRVPIMGARGSFTRLKLENWRNFKHVDVRLGARVFVVGPNASGKSNLLDVFRFLQEVAADGGGLTNALLAPNRGGIRAVRSLHAGNRNQVSIEVGAVIDGVEWTYRLVLEATGTSQRPGPARVVLEYASEDGEMRLDRPDENDQRDPELLEATALEQRSANAAFRRLRDFLRSTEYIHVVPQLVRQPKVEDTTRFGKGLGTSLIEAIASTKVKDRDRRLRRITGALRTVLPEFEKLEPAVDKAGRPHLEARFRHWRKGAAKQRETDFSDGTLRLVGLLWYLSSGDAPLLLEEPELSLHPGAVRQIPRILAGVVSESRRQVIMSTHSPELLGDRGIDPSEVVLLRTTSNGTGVAVGTDEPSLVEAAAADLPLGPFVEALTRPEGILKLAAFGAEA
jgi:predicted ATPase